MSNSYALPSPPKHNPFAPMGTDSVPYPAGGNAKLVTRDSRTGSAVTTKLWLSSIYTDLNLQIDTDQLRGGLTYRPIRFQERFLTFTTLFNVRKRWMHEQLVDRILDHWRYNLMQGQVGNSPVTPMFLTYYGANKTFKGFIEAADRQYAVTDVVLAFDFRMRVFNEGTNSDLWASVVGTAPFAPTSFNAKKFTSDWYGIGELLAEALNTLPPTTTGNQPNTQGNPLA